MKLKDYFKSCRIPAHEFITIKNFIALCDYVYKPKEELVVHCGLGSNKIIDDIPTEDSIIMCHIGMGEVLEVFDKCARNKKNRYIVIASTILDNSLVDEKLLKTMPDNVIRLYAKSVVALNDRAVPIPVGRDFRNEKAYLSFTLRSNNRKFKNLVYSNFAISTNPEVRQRVYDLFKKKEWVTTIEVKEWLNYPMAREEYLGQLHTHKFCLSPQGGATDCFRTWEALYLKSVPIVQEDNSMRAFKDLPILFTKDYSEITKEYLEEKYEEMLETDYNIDKLYFRYWKNLITETFGNRISNSYGLSQ